MQPTDLRTAAAAVPPCGALRGLAKKAGRTGLAASTWACGRLRIVCRGAPSPRLRVLTYHRCGRCVRDPFCVSPEMFDTQMRWLAEEQRAVSLADLEAFLAGRRSLPDGAVLVSVDDGCRSVLTEMLPAWQRHGLPAVVYVNPGLIEPRRQAQLVCRTDLLLPEPLMTWDELAKLVEAGITIGSHGLTHRSLGWMSEEEAREEVVASRQLLEERLGVDVRSFAYPFGTRADFTPATARLLAEAGYTTAMTSQHGAITPERPALRLPRIKVEGGEGLWMFRLLCRGGLDGWRVVDHHLWRLQAAKKGAKKGTGAYIGQTGKTG